MEQHTEELAKVATPQEISRYLEMLTKVHFLGDQADLDYKQLRADVNVTQSAVAAAYYYKRDVEAQYVRLSEWLWDNTPHGIYFDHENQRYALR